MINLSTGAPPVRNSSARGSPPWRPGIAPSPGNGAGHLGLDGDHFCANRELVEAEEDSRAAVEVYVGRDHGGAEGVTRSRPGRVPAGFARTRDLHLAVRQSTDRDGRGIDAEIVDPEANGNSRPG